jgi:serine/threonine-protein kinase
VDAGTATEANPSATVAARCGNAPGQLFLPSAPWNKKIADARVHADSSKITSYLQANHTASGRFQIDFSMTLFSVSPGDLRLPFKPNDAHWTPDCDTTPVPITRGARLEGESGTRCEHDGDCHLLLQSLDDCRLYEMFKADLTEKRFSGGCLAVWDLSLPYNETLRGDQCSSADAAGLPISPLLFSADEIHRGVIQHALRFVLPNKHIRHRKYVRPATHSTSATSGPAEAPPYGTLLRLRSDFPLDQLKPAVRVVAEALQRYGMYLADGGDVTFTALHDDSSTVTWPEVKLGPHDLSALTWSNFEVVDTGPEIHWGGNCSRAVPTD